MSIPEYELEEGVKKLVELINAVIAKKSKDETTVVNIAGGSSSGKTEFVARPIKKLYGKEAGILLMDDYFRGAKFMKSQARKGIILNWDQPEAIDIERINIHISHLANGFATEKPIYSFKTGEPEEEEIFHPKKILLVDGLFALMEPTINKADIKVFVEAGTKTRMLRRLFRDIVRTTMKPIEILRYFIEIVEPAHKKYVLPTKENADLIINNEKDIAEILSLLKL